MARIGVRIGLLNDFRRSSTYQDNLIGISSSNHRRYYFIVRIDERHQLTSLRRFILYISRAKLGNNSSLIFSATELFFCLSCNDVDPYRELDDMITRLCTFKLGRDVDGSDGRCCRLRISSRVPTRWTSSTRCRITRRITPERT